MSRTLHHAGRRRSYTPSVDQKAGDLVYQHGFFGYLDDDVDSGRLGTMILEGVANLKNVFGSNINPGIKVSANPTHGATTLQIFPAPSVPSGGVAIGRVWATSPASSASAIIKVQLFNPNQY